MSDCCPCDDQKEPGLETIRPGLPLVPRQERSFPEARRALLASLGAKPAWARWRAREGDDFAVLTVEMWAYIADVLGFYDERVANETYLRTAHRRASLRRIVGLLGYSTPPGVGGRALVAAVADGAELVTLPARTGFRSVAFNGQQPQVFETAQEHTVDPLKNEWAIEPFLPARATAPDRIQTEPAPGGVLPATGASLPSSVGGVASLEEKESGEPQLFSTVLFEPQGFGLGRDQFVKFSRRDNLIGAPPVSPEVTRVKDVTTVQGQDGRTYAQVTLDPAIRIASGIDVRDVKVETPTVRAGVTNGFPSDVARFTLQRVYLNGVYRQLRRGDPFLIVKDDRELFLKEATAVDEQPVSVFAPMVEGNTNIPVTRVGIAIGENEIASFVDIEDRSRWSFHFAFVDAGTLTRVRLTDVSAAALSDPAGVPISGFFDPPADSAEALEETEIAFGTDVVGLLEQPFYLADDAGQGVVADGRMIFRDNGTVTFQAMDAEQLPRSLKTPIRIFGNVIPVTRGESVRNEVIGSGDPRIPRQRFSLKKSPLTYLERTTESGEAFTTNTLEILVDGIQWEEVPSFFGCGPQDQVYTVHHDDDMKTFVTFGDGVRGARVPAGVGNVVANYRFGAGAAAPPPGAIRQIVRPVRGLRRVFSPAAAMPGKDPATPEELREHAPKSALLLGRAISAEDFAAITRESAGVVQAFAQWLWIDSQMRSGVHVFYIGDASADEIKKKLRARAEPTVALEVTKARPISTDVDITIEVDPRRVADDVARRVHDSLLDPDNGFLSKRRAQIGGTFWPSRLYDAIADIPGVVSVQGIAFDTGSGPLISTHGGACIPTGAYLDFTSPDAVTVVGGELRGPAPGVERRHGQG